MSDLLTLANGAAALLGAALILYAVFAGADFGAGIWIAVGALRRRDRYREPLLHAIGPVWETNHIWLIVVVVTLFTAFPQAFGALFIALLAPLVLLLLGVTFRGAAFAFWHYGETSPQRLPAMVEVLAVASVLTPFFMAMAVAAPAGGGLVLEGREVVSGPWESWLSPFTAGAGVVGVAVCAYLTPIYMTVRTEGELRDGYRARGIAGALFLGAATAAMLPVAWRWAPDFFSELGRPVPIGLVLAAVILGVTALGDLWVRQYRAAQLTAALVVTATLAAFLAALYPDLILGELSIDQAAAPRATLLAYLIALGAGAVLLVPSLWLLYYTYRGNPDPAAPPGRPDYPLTGEPPGSESP